MKEEILTDTLLRQYLLGKTDDDERQRIEKLFITDSQTRERVLAAEQELIEDYLEDGLSAADKEIFLSHYARTPEQQRKLRITKSIKDWAMADAKTSPVYTSRWSRFRERLSFRPVFVIPVVVVVLIVIAIAWIWMAERRNSSAIEREVAELNTRERLSTTPAQMLALELTPVSVRSGGLQNELTKREEVQVVELVFPAIQREQYQAYRASIYRVEDKKPLVTFDIKPENSNKIRLRLPANRLNKGTYRIELSGLAADSSTGPIEEYTLSVVQ
jgi:anti-sigma factor RsiW